MRLYPKYDSCTFSNERISKGLHVQFRTAIFNIRVWVVSHAHIANTKLSPSIRFEFVYPIQRTLLVLQIVHRPIVHSSCDIWGQGRGKIDNWGGGTFIHSCSAQLISFEIDYFYSL